LESNCELQIGYGFGIVLKIKTAWMCEAVLPKPFGNLANHSDEAALTHTFSSPALPVRPDATLMLSMLGQIQDCPRSTLRIIEYA